MDERLGMLREVVKQTNRAQRDGHTKYRLELEPFGELVRVVFNNNRHQDITIEEDGDYYVMTSMVMGAQRVQNMGVDEVFLPWLWERNAHIDIVAFTLDKKGRLVGRTTHLKQTMDQEELRLYIEILARECDLLEYQLTGIDTQ